MLLFSQPTPGELLIADDYLKEYCRTKFKQIQPTLRNPGIGDVARFFDDLENEEFEQLLPIHIDLHLHLVPTYVETGTFNVWAFKLAKLVREYLIEGTSIRADILNLDGVDSKLRQMFGLLARSDINDALNIIEKQFCEAFICRITQSLVLDEGLSNALHELPDHELLKSMMGFVDEPAQLNINLCVRKLKMHLDELRIHDLHSIELAQRRAIENNLKLNTFNHEHIYFWGEHADKGWFGFGGKPITISADSKVRVPGRVSLMMNASDDLDYDAYLEHLHQLKSASRFKNPFGQSYRAPLTQALYDSPNLEYVNIELTKVQLETQDHADHELGGLSTGLATLSVI